MFLTPLHYVSPIRPYLSFSHFLYFCWYSRGFELPASRSVVLFLIHVTGKFLQIHPYFFPLLLIRLRLLSIKIVIYSYCIYYIQTCAFLSSRSMAGFDEIADCVSKETFEAKIKGLKESLK